MHHRRVCRLAVGCDDRPAFSPSGRRLSAHASRLTPHPSLLAAGHSCRLRRHLRLSRRWRLRRRCRLRSGCRLRVCCRQLRSLRSGRPLTGGHHFPDYGVSCGIEPDASHRGKKHRKSSRDSGHDFLSPPVRAAVGSSGKPYTTTVTRQVDKSRISLEFRQSAGAEFGWENSVGTGKKTGRHEAGHAGVFARPGSHALRGNPLPGRSASLKRKLNSSEGHAGPWTQSVQDLRYDAERRNELQLS